MKDRLGSPAPPAAGETSAVAAESAQRLSRLADYTIPRVVSPIPKCYFESFESFFLKTTRPIALISLLVFRRQK
jgi:hypothetical protein